MAICNKYTAKWCKIIKLGVTEFYACGCGVLGLQTVNPGQSWCGNVVTGDSLGEEERLGEGPLMLL